MFGSWLCCLCKAFVVVYLDERANQSLNTFSEVNHLLCDLLRAGNSPLLSSNQLFNNQQCHGPYISPLVRDLLHIQVFIPLREYLWNDVL